jgi:hypothetical protein
MEPGSGPWSRGQSFLLLVLSVRRKKNEGLTPMARHTISELASNRLHDVIRAVRLVKEESGYG